MPNPLPYYLHPTVKETRNSVLFTLVIVISRFKQELRVYKSLSNTQLLIKNTASVEMFPRYSSPISNISFTLIESEKHWQQYITLPDTVSLLCTFC